MPLSPVNSVSAAALSNYFQLQIMLEGSCCYSSSSNIFVILITLINICSPSNESTQITETASKSSSNKEQLMRPNINIPLKYQIHSSLRKENMILM